jgi:hypothetical protein
MVVMSNAKPGREAEFNDWYSNVHVYDTINKLDGFLSGQRFQLADLDGAPEHPFRYLAVYEIPAGKLETAYQHFRWQRGERADALAAGREPQVPVSGALSTDAFLVGFFSPITERIESTRTRKD